MKQREEYSDIIDMEVRYEDLIRHPNSIQENIVNLFGMEKGNHFSEYPEYVKDWIYDWNVSVLARAGKGNDSDYGKRKLSDKGVGKNLDAYKNICNADELADFENQLRKAGYLN